MDKKAQPCTRVADYFLLPFPTDWEKRVVESLPVGQFAQKWIPISHGGFITATNCVNVSAIVGYEEYASCSVVLLAEHPCNGLNYFLEHTDGMDNPDWNDKSKWLWETVYNSIAREFGCEP